MAIDMVDYHTPRFKSGDVARAIGMPINTFRTNFKRGHFRVIGNMNAAMADQHGLPNLFSLRDVMGFAVAAPLMAAASDKKKAFDFAMTHFAHTGDERRRPGATFDIHEQGETIILFDPFTGHGRLMAVEGDLPTYELFRFGGAGAFVLNVNYIEANVFAALGIDPA